MKACFVSLGCPKNLTDTEVLMGKFASLGYEITSDPSRAEAIIVNTCAFLKSARDEAIKTIQEMAGWKKKGKCKKLYVAGCLPKFPLSLWERGIGGEGIDGIINSIGFFNSCTPRIKATPPWTAYVKIAEGCDNRCSYCLVPKIRGKLRTRKMEDILEEVKSLVKKGVKEIIYVAQDTTAYPNFAKLLQKTAKIKSLRWIRILYAHPAHVNDAFIHVLKSEKKIVKYLDLPIQHASDTILKRMRRPYNAMQVRALTGKLRKEIPRIALRTTLMVGFPGESEADFAALVKFVKEMRFDRLGVFPYSREEGTPAAKMKHPVLQKIKFARMKRVLRLQARISRAKNQALAGKTMEVLVEGKTGRTYRDAPEIDGKVFLLNAKQLTPGNFIRTTITAAKTHDLVAQIK